MCFSNTRINVFLIIHCVPAFYALEEGVYYVDESQTALEVSVARVGDLTVPGTVGKMYTKNLFFDVFWN